MDYSSLSFKIYGFHAATATHPALQASSYPYSTVYSPMGPHQSPLALAAAPGSLQAVTSPASFATAGNGIAGLRISALENLHDGQSAQSRKRYKASPSNKELWRGKLCEGSAVEVHWGKDWWNAHVIQVRPVICTVHSLAAVPIILDGLAFPHHSNSLNPPSFLPSFLPGMLIRHFLFSLLSPFYSIAHVIVGPCDMC